MLRKGYTSTAADQQINGRFPVISIALCSHGCRWKSGSPLFVRASLQFNTCYTDVGRVTSLGQVNPLDLLQESGYDDIVEVLEQSEKARDGG